jgi:cell division septation protein DedD
VPAAGSWWVQLGSFSSRENAARLAQKLRAAGFAIDLSAIRSGSKDLYRVRAGPVATREAALSLQARLGAGGHKATLVAP